MADPLGATVIDVDRFGNLGLNITREHVDEPSFEALATRSSSFTLRPYYAVVAETYADATRGDLILYEDSYGAFAIAISGGNASRLPRPARATRSHRPPPT